MTTAQATNMQIANTILAQLGGARFRMMTGTKICVAIENGLRFKIGRFPGIKINFVQITLNGRDLYDIEFSQVRGVKNTILKMVEDVYAEDLQRVFTDVTGLDTHL